MGAGNLNPFVDLSVIISEYAFDIKCPHWTCLKVNFISSFV